MRILHCVPSMEGGGTERQVAYLARELVRRGCDVHVALTRGGANFEGLAASGASIHNVGTLRNHDPRIFLRLYRLIRRLQPDVCQCWLLQMQILAGLVCRWQRVPWLFSERSSEKAYPATLKNRLRIRMASLADGIVSNSAAGDDYWRTRAGGHVSRYVVPNGLPLGEIAAVSPVDPRAAGLRAHVPLVLYAGRLDAAKNAEVLVRALARLGGDIRFQAVLCGDGPQRLFLAQLVREVGAADRIRLEPYAENLWGLMKRASVLVSPSRFEGSPNVVLEAMACGCPLVVSDIPAHRELLDERSAVFAKSDDPGALAASIEAVLRDPGAARRRAEVAHARAQEYGLDAVAERYLDIYHAVRTRRARTMDA